MTREQYSDLCIRLVVLYVCQMATLSFTVFIFLKLY
jgi:hypothetical protein